MPAWPNFIGGSYRYPLSPYIAAERCVNMFPTMEQSPGARAQLTLMPTPGYFPYLTLDQFPGRGLFYQAGRMFAVSGAGFYEINLGAATFTLRGAVGNDGNRVTMVSNGKAGNQIAICSAGNIYIFNLLTNVLSGSVLANTLRVGFLGGYFIALDSVSGALHRSNLFDGTVWDPTTANRSLAGDPWQSFVVAHSEIWLFGEKTSEVWYQSGAIPFPFEPIPGAFFERGIVAPDSVGVINNKVTWLGNTENGSLSALQEAGYFAQPISNQAVEAVWQFVTNKAGTAFSAEASVYTSQLHGHYILNFAAAKMTWGWDSFMGLWHERGRWNGAIGDFDASRIRAVAAYYPTAGASNYATGVLAIDNTTGDLYLQNPDTPLEVDGTGIKRYRISPNLIDDGLKRLNITNFALDIETGVGTNAGQGQNPQVVAAFSTDGGRTWGPDEPRSLGAIGQWRTRVIWEKLGNPRQFRVRFYVTDPVTFRVAGAWINVNP